MSTKNITVIDVRSPMEFSGGNVEGSINIPLDKLPQKIKEIQEINEPILVCCASGVRSMSACQYLRQNGIDNVSDAGSWFNVPGLIAQN